MVDGTSPSIIALIPARSGSSRVRHKNIRPLGDHPLIAYTIAAAMGSGIFSAVVVSTDAPVIADAARHYGAELPFLRPAQFAGDRSPDIGWVDYTLRRLQAEGREFDCFSILRPTSPFRTAETIRRAWREFREEEGVDSLRAVEPCRQHPGKMWVVQGRRMVPLLPLGWGQTPWHSTQYQALPVVYAQNASQEIAWSRVVFEERGIAGDVVMPFFTTGFEGFDINDMRDWWYAEELMRRGEVVLPHVPQPPLPMAHLAQ